MTMYNSQGNLLQVTVPADSGPGQALLVRALDGQGTISAIVPVGCHEGDTFYVQPPPVEVSVPAIHEPECQQQTSALENDGYVSDLSDEDDSSQQLEKHKRQKQKKQWPEKLKLLQEKGLVKVKVPRGLKAGDRFKLRFPDGRTMDVVVPPGDVSEFYMKFPGKTQHWHDSSFCICSGCRSIPKAIYTMKLPGGEFLVPSSDSVLATNSCKQQEV